MSLHTDLPIYRTGTDLLAMGYLLQRDMPRGFKRSLGEKIVQGCTDMLELMALANATRHADRADPAAVRPRQEDHHRDLHQGSMARDGRAQCAAAGHLRAGQYPVVSPPRKLGANGPLSRSGFGQWRSERTAATTACSGTEARPVNP